MASTTKLKSEMARAYGVSIVTLRKWLKQLGIEGAHKYLTPAEIGKIENHFGEPDYELVTPKPAGRD